MAIEKGGSSRVAWTWEQDKAFEVGLTRFSEGSLNRWENIAANIPGHVTPEEVEHHYQLLVADVAAIEAGNVTLPNYKIADYYQDPEQETRDVITNDEGVVEVVDRNAVWESRKGIAWSEAEHARFLLGIRRYGNGDWKSIAKDFVKTRSSTQVASHAQKHFQRHDPRRKKDGKRWSIFDISSDDLTDEQLRELGEEEGIEFDQQSGEQVTGLTHQQGQQQASFDQQIDEQVTGLTHQQGQQQASFDQQSDEQMTGLTQQGQQQASFAQQSDEQVTGLTHQQGQQQASSEVDQQEEVEGSAVQEPVIMPSLGINNGVDRVQQLMPGFNEVVGGWGSHSVVQALCANLPIFGTNAAGQAFGGINGGLPTFGTNAAGQAFGGINGGLPTFGTNAVGQAFGGINGGLPTFGINAAMQPFGCINGGLQTFGINGGLPRFSFNGGLPRFSFNGGRPRFSFGGAVPPFGTNGALPTFGGNGAVQTFGTNEAGNIENGVPQAQQMSPPMSPPGSWYFDSDDDDYDDDGSGSGDAGNQSHQQPPAGNYAS